MYWWLSSPTMAASRALRSSLAASAFSRSSLLWRPSSLETLSMILQATCWRQDTSG